VAATVHVRLQSGKAPDQLPELHVMLPQVAQLYSDSHPSAQDDPLARLKGAGGQEPAVIGEAMKEVARSSAEHPSAARTGSGLRVPLRQVSVSEEDTSAHPAACCSVHELAFPDSVALQVPAVVPSGGTGTAHARRQLKSEWSNCHTPPTHRTSPDDADGA